MTTYSVETVGRHVAQWGEGPLWWKGRLLYVDIEGHKVLCFDPDRGEEESWDVGERVGTVVPRASGGLVIAGDNGISFFDPSTGEKKTVADPESEKRPDNRFNDGKCDPSGRFWAGTISLVKKTGDAKLYMLDTGRQLHEKIPGVTNSNGIAWSADHTTLYYIDTPTKKMQAFDYDNVTGAIANPRVCADFTTFGVEGSPDGMTMDAEGNLWVAVCHGGCVLCIDPATGAEVRRVDFPCIETTACAFGGEALDVLYVTTGVKKDLEEKSAGRLFAVHGLGVKGCPAVAYGG